MADFSMADIAGLMGVGSGNLAQNSTSRPNNTELNMEDFLQLMIVQLTNQSIDDAMDTSEMMNQMVQMQMISAITNLTASSVMGYASSLVGKVVTVGLVKDNKLEEREILVMGTGTLNGQQVIFGSDGETYALNQIMAVGRLPDENGKYPGLGGDGDGDGDGDGGVEGGDGTGDGDGAGGVEGGDGTGDGDGTGGVEGGGGTGDGDGTGGVEGGGGSTGGEQGAPETE